MNQDIERRVIELAAEQVGVDPLQVTREHHFTNDLNYDSLDTVEFAMKLEDEFELSVADVDAQGIATVSQAVDLVQRELAARATTS